MSGPRSTALLLLTTTLAALAVRPAAATDPLTVTIAAPADGATVADDVALSATTTGEAVSVAFAWSTHGLGPWTDLGPASGGPGSWTATWDTRPYRGPAVLRATATAPDSSTAEDTVAVAVENPSVAIASSRPAISPNGDGVADGADLVVTVGDDVDLVLRILDGSAAPIRVWTLGTVPAGATTVPWDGRDDGGTVAPDGDYTAEARATNAGGNEGVASTVVTVDTVPPRISWRGIRPEPASGRKEVRFLHHLNDRPAPVTVTMLVRDALGPVREVARTEVPGDQALAWRPRYRSRALLFPGEYWATLVARDAAGNVGRSRTKPWRIHRAVSAHVYARLPGAGAKVAITIDDCHVESAWRSMLRTLRERHVEATFFCPASVLGRYPYLARRTTRQGHAVGSHAWDHAFLPGHTVDYTARRLRADSRRWWRLSHDDTAPYFRPPYGAYDANVLRAASRTSHPRVILWDVDTQDWARPGTSTIVSRALSNARRGSIILLHTLDQSAAALPAIISGLRDRGLHPVSLPRLFRAAGYR